MEQKNFGEFIKDQRMVFGYSLNELGKDLGCSAPYLCKLENGKEIPSSEMIKKLARVLEIDIGELSKMAAIIQIENMKTIPLEDKNAIISFYKVFKGETAQNKSRKVGGFK